MTRELFLLLSLFTIQAFADEALDYQLVAERVAEDTYVFVGAKEDFSQENGGNIVNTGFIVTEQGIVVIDTGPSYLYGQQMRQAIRRVSDKPVIKVLITHHHPDHFLGNQAFNDVPIFAHAQTITQLKSDASGFLDNLYKMVGPWMRGTDVSIKNVQPLSISHEQVANHSLRYIYLSGHTAADLIVLDETTGVLFAGDLVFHNRSLTTPHADPEQWLDSLELIKDINYKIIIPGHGEVSDDLGPVEQTIDYLIWLETAIRDAVNNGLEMNEVLSLTIPRRFEELRVVNREFIRSVSHRFPVYEEMIFNNNE